MRASPEPKCPRRPGHGLQQVRRGRGGRPGVSLKAVILAQWAQRGLQPRPTLGHSRAPLAQSHTGPAGPLYLHGRKGRTGQVPSLSQARSQKACPLPLYWTTGSFSCNKPSPSPSCPSHPALFQGFCEGWEVARTWAEVGVSAWGQAWVRLVRSWSSACSGHPPPGTAPPPGPARPPRTPPRPPGWCLRPDLGFPGLRVGRRGGRGQPV